MTTLDITKFDPTVAELNTLVASYETLAIKGIDDEEGYALVKDAQQTLAKQRITLEKTGKAMREDALAFQKAVIAKEKELKSIIEPLETRFKLDIARVDHLREADRRKGMLPARRAKADGLMLDITDEQLLSMDETQFVNYIQEEQRKNIEAANARIAQEQADLKAREDAVRAKELEAQRLVELEAAKEAARLQGIKETEEKAARDKADAERRQKEADDLKAKQEADAKKKEAEDAHYQARLQSFGYNEDEYFVSTRDGIKTIWKKMGIYESFDYRPSADTTLQQAKATIPYPGYDPAIGF